MNNYFSHDSNARNSDKIIPLRAKHNAEGYGVYFMILERLREENDYSSVKDYNMLAFDLRVSSGLIKSVVEDFGLFSFTEDGERFYSEGFRKRMFFKDQKSERLRDSAQKKWKSREEENSSKRSERLANARKKGTHTAEEWGEMIDFFRCCLICGKSTDEVVIVKDHIEPIYQGGSDGIENLQPLCKSCNSRKGPDNTDHRIKYCTENACEMPAKWEKTPAKTPAKCLQEKERKEKERKECAAQRASGENFNFSQMRTDPDAQTLLAETITAWNKIPHVVKCDALHTPEFIQLEFFQRLHEHGADKIRLAVAKMADAYWWKSGSTTKASFQTFVNAEKFQKLIDGIYDKDFGKTPKDKNADKRSRFGNPEDAKKGAFG